MNFWAIGYKWQQDVFFNFLTEGTYMDMNEEYLLPTEDMALSFIMSNLNSDFTPVLITVESLRNGVMTWNRGPVSEWDEMYDVDDYYDGPLDVVDAIADAIITEEIIEDEIIEEEIFEEGGGW